MADIVYPGQVGGRLGNELLPSNFDLVFWQGDYFPIDVTISAGGIPVDLTGHVGKAQIRATDGSVFEFEVTIPTPATGLVRLLLPSSVSRTIPAGSYIWDFQVTNPSGNVRTYIAGDVEVHSEVTV